MQTPYFIQKIENSIAILPSGISLCFCLLAFILNFLDLRLDPDGVWKHFLISNKEDNQVIYSFVIGGIFTLTIFSYTMVMNVLNRNINNYSPRLIPLLLSEKHHQLILGVTSGTIIYSMIMATAVSLDKNDGYPAIGASIAILFAITCVILFIYFIHSISQSIHINHIFKDMYLNTVKNQVWINQFNGKSHPNLNTIPEKTNEIYASKCGYIQKPNFESLLKISSKYKVPIYLQVYLGEFVYTGQCIAKYGPLENNVIQQKIAGNIPISGEVPMELVETGIKHFVEVAVKASSPAINDPGTSRTAIEYLTQILIDYKAIPHSINLFDGIVVTKTLDFETIKEWCFAEMERYMKDDPMLVIILENSRKKILEYRKA